MSGIDPTPELSRMSACDLEFFTQDQAGDVALRKLGRRPGPGGKWSNEDCEWLFHEIWLRGLIWFVNLISKYPVKEGPQLSRDELEKLRPVWEGQSKELKDLQRKALRAAYLKAMADFGDARGVHEHVEEH